MMHHGNQVVKGLAA